VTNGPAPDGQAPVSVRGQAVRLQAGNPKGDVLRFALLAYSSTDVRELRTDDEQRRIDAGVAEVLARPGVTGWLRLHDAETATTVTRGRGATLLTDGPFVDSKDFLGGFILVEADDLDGALAVAAELQALEGTVAIEVRPVREEPPGA
jgi:hypothetical protein